MCTRWRNDVSIGPDRPFELRVAVPKYRVWFYASLLAVIRAGAALGMSIWSFSRVVPAFGLMVALAACGGGKTVAGPSSDQPLFVQCGTEWDGFQCRAIVGPVSSNPQDVTGFADWSTSDPSIATVDTVGWVTIRGSGTIAIRAMFRGQLAFETLPVAPREAPIQIRTFWGSITDAQSHAPLSGVTMQILDGPNAGRIAVTGPDGGYRMDDMGLTHTKTVFSFRVLFSKPGYIAIERVFTMTTNQFNELSLSLTKVPS